VFTVWCNHLVVPDGYGREEELSSAQEAPMTDTNEAVINEALTVIDKALAQMMSRELVSTGEVTDVLLDVRTLLTAPAKTPAPA
jgi:hypothetical protein